MNQHKLQTYLTSHFVGISEHNITLCISERSCIIWKTHNDILDTDEKSSATDLSTYIQIFFQYLKNRK